MVLMGVGGDDTEQMLATLDDKGRIGHHDVDTRLRIVAKGDAAIDDQPLAGDAVKVQVHPDFVRAPQRREKQRVRVLIAETNRRPEGKVVVHFLLFLRCISRSPHSVRSGSTLSMTSIAVANSCASPPVAITPISSPRSSRIRRTKPSTSPT